MAHNDIASRIAAIVSARLNDADQFASEDDLIKASIDSLKLDSLDLLEVIMEIEDAHEIELDEDRVMVCGTIAEMADLVLETRAA